jgi:hypothetical protein
VRRFELLEAEINGVLHDSCRKLLADPVKVAHYAGAFDRSAETGFYTSDVGPRGKGETPAWAPNPAYMESLEEIWEPVASLLESKGLALEKTLRELFYRSHEYRDHAADHRRIFHGHLIDAGRRRPVTYFMLNIPHSHAGFAYPTPPRIQIAESL